LGELEYTPAASDAAKRQKQAESLANLVQTRQTNDPADRIILVGDFNAFAFNDVLGDSMNVITGTPSPDNETPVVGDGADLVNPDLDSPFDTSPAPERFRSSGQESGALRRPEPRNVDSFPDHAARRSNQRRRPCRPTARRRTRFRG
jgi:hypothetical protein